MIRNYFRVIHITIEKIIIGNTQLRHDVPGKANTGRTNIPFYRKNKYSRVLNGDVHGTSTGPSCGKSMGPNDGTF